MAALENGAEREIVTSRDPSPTGDSRASDQLLHAPTAPREIMFMKQPSPYQETEVLNNAPNGFMLYSKKIHPFHSAKRKKM